MTLKKIVLYVTLLCSGAVFSEDVEWLGHTEAQIPLTRAIQRSLSQTHSTQKSIVLLQFKQII